MSTVKTPKVGETVIYFNDHGFPRAAVVTGTRNSLRGERHVAPVDTSTHIHLTALSPLSGARGMTNVPHAPGTRNAWAWPSEVDALL